MPPPNDEFTVLCVRILSGEGTPAERQRLSRLLRRPENQARYDELRAAWQACPEPAALEFDAAAAYRQFSARLAAKAEIARFSAESEVSPTPRKGQLIRPWFATVAAAAAIMLGISVWLARPAAPAPYAPWIVRTTHTGEKSTVQLEDGTQVTLSGNSSLTYPASFADGRRARLVGEAYFEVAHDAVHPFVVFAGDMKTTVLGTKFDVRALPDDRVTSVALVEGRVAVEPVHPAKRAEPMLLHPGQQYTLERIDQAAHVATFDRSVALDWMSDAMVFRDEPLATVAARLEHRFGLECKFTEPGMANTPISAEFHGEGLNQILQAISFATGLEYEMHPGTTTAVQIVFRRPAREEAHRG